MIDEKIENIKQSLLSPKKWGILARLILTSAIGTSFPVFGQSVQPIAAEQIENVRGRESIVETLSLGPLATEIWRSVRGLIANPDRLLDFSEIADSLGLTIMQRGKSADVSSKEFEGPWTATDRRYFKISSASYTIVPATDSSRQGAKYAQLFLRLDLAQICISDREVHRIYGHGKVGIPSHGGVSKEMLDNPVETGYSESYGTNLGDPPFRSPLVFTFAISGCLESIRLQKQMTGN